MWSLFSFCQRHSNRLPISHPPPKGIIMEHFTRRGVSKMYTSSQHWETNSETLLKASIQISEELIFHRFYKFYIMFSSTISICLSKKNYHHWYEIPGPSSNLRRSIGTAHRELLGFWRTVLHGVKRKVSKREKCLLIWVFPKIGVPQNGWFTMENPIV